MVRKHGVPKYVKPILKSIEWDEDGRANCGNAVRMMMEFFRTLCDNVADQCKFIVHSFNHSFYMHAQKQFDELATNPQFTQRITVNANKYSYMKLGAKYVNYYRTGHEVAHYFLRTFRHSEDLDQIVAEYHQAWYDSKGKGLDPSQATLLQSTLKSFLEAELRMFDKCQRLDCEKNIIQEMITDDNILLALHSTLLEMKDKVVLLFWCSEWKNEVLFFFHPHGPCRNLLQAKQDKTPTLKRDGVSLRFSGIFNLQTSNACSKISCRTWIWLIQASYNHELDQYFEWTPAGQDEIKTCEEDKTIYWSKYKQRQKKYIADNPYSSLIYKWSFLDTFLHGTQSCLVANSNITFITTGRKKKPCPTMDFDPGDVQTDKQKEEEQAAVAAFWERRWR